MKPEKIMGIMAKNKLSDYRTRASQSTVKTLRSFLHPEDLADIKRKSMAFTGGAGALPMEEEDDGGVRWQTQANGSTDAPADDAEKYSV